MKKIKVLTVILAITLMIVGCSNTKTKQSSSESSIKSQSSIDAKYINLTMVTPKTINPITNTDKSVGYIMNLIYDGLFTIDENYNVTPQLVKEYNIAQDGMSIDIKLNDAKWHDGKAVTSNDVNYTIGLIQKSAESPYNEFTKNIASVNIKSDKDFTIKFKAKYAFSIDSLIFPIVSQNHLDSKDVNDKNNNMIGNGKYKIESYTEREGMILSVNKDYYEEVPKAMKNVKVGMVPNEDARTSMVMALDSDITNVTLNDLSKFQEKEFNITKYQGRDYECVLFNYNNSFFKDVNFRKAIAHSINKNRIISEGYMDDATPVNFPLNSKSKYYSSDVKDLEYNKDKAIEYLNKIEYANINAVNTKNDKVDKKQKKSAKKNTKKLTAEEQKKAEQEEAERVKKEAEDKKNKEKEEVKKRLSEMNLKIIVNKDNSERLKTSHIISENLKAIGINNTINQLSDKEMESALNSKNYDLALVGWNLSSVPDVSSIIASSGYTDDKLNGYMSALTSSASEIETKKAYKVVQKYVRDNATFISLAIRNNYIVSNSRLKGKITPNEFDVYEGISNLDISSNESK
ncbi:MULTISPECIES: ABC transporter substrate-binding protein [unclassified Clostridioides]|uniref:ABC transporter substrate-binding protein n=1 Tax=unclassified Clostridioides TaxID=2635829 RepID=UPI001D12E657|nr:ABC transporter substrate-binding protein [Clostridioides sp. ZZV14-6150]MCC0659856.1 ABC transporter substrate-binding protein [Clostridioides sp. ZZV14-6154]MCC0666629.1 ABC transporter substrate-binding protein [Clostridioides sp. ZZV14-6153]MCC0717651.1 ABC transporter substrate-binding protein [Clostridioides sp. ZZV14-6105]MCC0722780.1 ABC transporter substrate-binding protein [Clostridioides sp. ZZV14-6104]MCC0725346.1 ABC transporter substrate-binding protein [Clostridioides sp. ZZV